MLSVTTSLFDFSYMIAPQGAAQSAIEAMDLYDRERVTNNRGLTVTSQRKFVIFYEALWRQCWGVTGNIGEVSSEEASHFRIPDQPAYRIKGVEVLNVPAGLVGSFRIVTSKVTFEVVAGVSLPGLFP